MNTQPTNINYSIFPAPPAQVQQPRRVRHRKNRKKNKKLKTTMKKTSWSKFDVALILTIISPITGQLTNMLYAYIAFESNALGQQTLEIIRTLVK